MNHRPKMLRFRDTQLIFRPITPTGSSLTRLAPLRYTALAITSVHFELEKEHEGFSQAMIGLHALTGTDYTASFYKKGKKMPFNILKNSGNSEWFSALAAMSKRSQVDYGTIENFVCFLNATPSLGYKDINQLCRDKLCKLAGKKEWKVP